MQTVKPSDEVSRAREAARMANELGVRTFAQLNTTKRNENSLLSPLSLGFTCALVADGCGGTTKAEVLKAFSKIGQLPADDAWYQLRTLVLSPRKSVQQIVATGLFADSKAVFQPSFQQNCAPRFNADLKTASFQSPGALELINKWVSEKTNNRVKSTIDQLSPEVVVLLSALYFNGEWLDKFETTATAPADFTLLNGQNKKVQMMSKGFSDHPVNTLRMQMYK